MYAECDGRNVTLNFTDSILQRIWRTEIYAEFNGRNFTPNFMNEFYAEFDGQNFTHGILRTELNLRRIWRAEFYGQNFNAESVVKCMVFKIQFFPGPKFRENLGRKIM